MTYYCFRLYNYRLNNDIVALQTSLTSAHMARARPITRNSSRTTCSVVGRPIVDVRKSLDIPYNQRGKTNIPVIAYVPTGVLKPVHTTSMVINVLVNVNHI